MTEPTPTSAVPNVPPSRRNWWGHIHFQHRSMRRHIIRFGYWTSIAFMALVLLTPMIGQYLYPYREWIGFSYLVIQSAEINAEDHLRNKDVLWDHLFSSFSALIGLVMVALFYLTDKAIAPSAWDVLTWFTACAWFDFIGGIILNNTILNAPYQREERDDN